MFAAARVDVTALLADENELVIAFRSLDAELAQRRPRPRWKTRLVENQSLRWIRTTLLGRMPGWTPTIAPVGPWGPVVLESVSGVDVSAVSVQARVPGRVVFSAHAEALEGRHLERARLRVGDYQFDLDIDGNQVRGECIIPDAPRWWPHTHGAPRLLACRLELELDGELVTHDCGRIGFRDIAVDQTDGGVRLSVNGVPVFCRGAVWTTADILRLRGTAHDLRAALVSLRDAGANMVRVGGTMTYESDEFYALCDELGLLVWQDFMFANMDYPVADDDFRAEVEAEARQQVARLSVHPSVAVWCGGSEVAQQAAMQGLPREAWGGELFERLLPAIVAEADPRAPYFPSTPWGGALPMHVATGISHYYGVGAYRRPLADVKSARVKFAAECLGFANVPDGVAAMRAPRDNGASYDFGDIRDHYLGELFRCDPVELRMTDHDRYLAASRAVTGEAMQCTYSEWRAPASGCGGALVWFARDLWPGAGWGIMASDGTPKAAYWYLKRAWAPIAVRLTDEGLDGVAIHVLNESASALDAKVEIETYRHGRPTATRAEAPVKVAPRSGTTLSMDALLGRFSDANHAYRFGPPAHDVVAVRLLDAMSGAVLSEDFHFPLGLELPRLPGAFESKAQWDGDAVVVTLSSDVFLQSVAIECDGFTPSDNHFHVAPGREKHVVFTQVDRARSTFKAHFEALNAPMSTTARAQCHPGDRPDETR
jgi:beta-mannosidase